MIVELGGRKVGICKAVILVEANLTSIIKENMIIRDKIAIPTTITNTISSNSNTTTRCTMGTTTITDTTKVVGINNRITILSNITVEVVRNNITKTMVTIKEKRNN